ncbi:MAG TPA: hypothetical protein VN704_00050 [Verrucomicrobiae bacterium]|nr:hypothetical protein [Verrucomicrobiae bacterium]
MSIEGIYIICTLIIGILLVSITLFLTSRLKKSSYDEKNKVAILDEVRSSLEKQVYILNERMIQNEERWKDVNHLLINKKVLNDSYEVSTQQKVQYPNFIKANGITENDLLIDDRFAFILTPFNTIHYNEYKTIKDTCEAIGFSCMRGDEKNFESDIFPQMLKLIVKAKVIIANINGRNANVLYELGIAHALDKHVILVSKEPNDIPIDIKSRRFLIYKDLNHLKTLLREELLQIPKT